MDDLIGDGGADAPAADKQPSGHQFNDRPSDGRTGQLEAVSEGELVLEGVAGLQYAGVHRCCELLCELVVERHGAVPVDAHLDLLGHDQTLAQG